MQGEAPVAGSGVGTPHAGGNPGGPVPSHRAKTWAEVPTDTHTHRLPGSYKLSPGSSHPKLPKAGPMCRKLAAEGSGRSSSLSFPTCVTASELANRQGANLTLGYLPFYRKGAGFVSGKLDTPSPVHARPASAGLARARPGAAGCRAGSTSPAWEAPSHDRSWPCQLPAGCAGAATSTSQPWRLGSGVHTVSI